MFGGRFVLKTYASLERHKKNLLNNREKKSQLVEDPKKMEGLPLQPPSASLGAAGVRRASSRALRGGFCGSGILLGRISLSLLRKTNKQYFFFSPIGSVYDCVISFSCSRENVVSLSEDGERLFIKRDGNKAESWSGRLGPFERGQEGQKGKTGTMGEH